MGKQDVMAKILPKGKGVWVPIDHGVTDFPCAGLENIEATITAIIAGGANVIVAHKGVVDKYSHLCEGTAPSMIAKITVIKSSLVTLTNQYSEVQVEDHFRPILVAKKNQQCSKEWAT